MDLESSLIRGLLRFFCSASWAGRRISRRWLDMSLALDGRSFSCERKAVPYFFRYEVYKLSFGKVTVRVRPDVLLRLWSCGYKAWQVHMSMRLCKQCLKLRLHQVSLNRSKSLRIFTWKSWYRDWLLTPKLVLSVNKFGRSMERILSDTSARKYNVPLFALFLIRHVVCIGHSVAGSGYQFLDHCESHESKVSGSYHFSIAVFSQHIWHDNLKGQFFRLISHNQNGEFLKGLCYECRFPLM